MIRYKTETAPPKDAELVTTITLELPQAKAKKLAHAIDKNIVWSAYADGELENELSVLYNLLNGDRVPYTNGDCEIEQITD